MDRGKVVPKPTRLTETDYRRIVARGIRRCAANGAGRFGIEVGCDERTMRNARDEKSTLAGPTLWNMLIVDRTALDELAAHFGKRLVDIDLVEADEKQLLADTLALASAHATALIDGRVDHREEPNLVKLARPVAEGWSARVARS